MQNISPEYAAEVKERHFSRNTVPVEMTAGAAAVIVGCGSVGSLIARTLAQAGVGRLILIDNDTLGEHNLVRHQCGRRDLGRRKVDAVADLAREFNQWLQVDTYPQRIEDMHPGVLIDLFGNLPADASVIVGCADSRRSDVYLARLAAQVGLPFVAIGLWDRAAAGEIFWQDADLGRSPCYDCIFGSMEEQSGRVEAHHDYVGTADPEMLNFMPGMGMDLELVTLVGAKLILDLLCRARPGYVLRLPDWPHWALVCTTNNPALGGELVEIFAYPFQVVTNVRLQHDAGCPPCRWQG